MKNTFSMMHPFTNLIFYCIVIGYTIFNSNPIITIISFLCAFLTALYVCGRKTLLFSLKFLLPMSLFITIINPLFNHQGVTVILYFYSGNALTLESILYGVFSAILLSAVTLWFTSFNKIMTTDKFIFLFGRFTPNIGQLLSMSFRFVPKFIRQYKVIKNAQISLGVKFSKEKLITKFKNIVKIISVMITWALENALQTADSMKCRGYSLKKKTFFSIYKLTKYDISFIIVSVITFVFVILISILNKNTFVFYPALKGSLFTVFLVVKYLLLLVIMLLPLIISVWGSVKWKISELKI